MAYSLCCLLNPSIHCQGCDTYWCQICDDKDIPKWGRKSFDHHTNGTSGWNCPSTKKGVMYKDYVIGSVVELLPNE